MDGPLGSRGAYYEAKNPATKCLDIRRLNFWLKMTGIMGFGWVCLVDKWAGGRGDGGVAIQIVVAKDEIKQKCWP